jgi:hypothetical protein
MWHEVFTAVALVFVIEGVLPFLNPAALRRALLSISELSDNALRFTGLSSMLVGLLLLHLASGS